MVSSNYNVASPQTLVHNVALTPNMSISIRQECTKFRFFSRLPKELAEHVPEWNKVLGDREDYEFFFYRTTKITKTGNHHPMLCVLIDMDLQDITNIDKLDSLKKATMSLTKDLKQWLGRRGE